MMVLIFRQCMVDEDLCSYAHSHEEQIVWGLEKDSKFSIQEFILQHRTENKVYGIAEVRFTLSFCQNIDNLKSIF